MGLMLNISFRPTKEALRRALSTRHMVRNKSLLLPGEKKPLLICVSQLGIRTLASVH